jgi:addiction module HigA family antidote
MKMKNPPHPGRLIKHECLEPLDLNITKAADILGVTRLTLSNLMNGKNGVSPEMAIRLSKAFGSSPEVWLGLQMDYDLAKAEKKASRIKVKKVKKVKEVKKAKKVIHA